MGENNASPWLFGVFCSVFKQGGLSTDGVASYLPGDREGCHIQEHRRTRPATTVLLALGLFPEDFLLENADTLRGISEILIPTERPEHLFYSFFSSRDPQEWFPFLGQ